MSDGAETGRPVLRVVRGDPTPEEVAALVAVVQGLAAAAAERRAAEGRRGRPRSEWAASVRTLRRTLPAGPGAWRASALPR